MVPDLHANTSPASTPKHMNPELHANQSPASTAKQAHHLHCSTIKLQNIGLDVYAVCVLCPLMPINSSANSFLLQMQHSTEGYCPEKEKNK